MENRIKISEDVLSMMSPERRLRDRKVFLEGVSFGAVFGVVWFLLWYWRVFMALDRTQNVMDIFDILSIGGRGSFALGWIAKKSSEERLVDIVDSTLKSI